MLSDGRVTTHLLHRLTLRFIIELVIKRAVYNILWLCALCSSNFIEDLLKGGYLISNSISLISNLDCLCSETKSQFNIKEKCPARIHVIIPRTLFKNLN